MSDDEMTTGELRRRLDDIADMARATDERTRDMDVRQAVMEQRLAGHIEAQALRTAGRNARCDRSEATASALGDRLSAVEKATERDQGEHTEERRPKQWPTIIGAVTSIGALITTIIIAIVSASSVPKP